MSKFSIFKLLRGQMSPSLDQGKGDFLVSSMGIFLKPREGAHSLLLLSIFNLKLLCVLSNGFNVRDKGLIFVPPSTLLLLFKMHQFRICLYFSTQSSQTWVAMNKYVGIILLFLHLKPWWSNEIWNKLEIRRKIFHQNWHVTEVFSRWHLSQSTKYVTSGWTNEY